MLEALFRDAVTEEDDVTKTATTATTTTETTTTDGNDANKVIIFNITRKRYYF